jgi:transcriptional regulator with XRE-family HTH domain
VIITATISIKYCRGDIMDEQFIRDRISFLRTQKGISEYKMSLDLGHSKSYIQSISNGRALPSLAEFLYICDYLGVTPQEFFDTDCETPQLAHELSEITKNMCKEDLEALITMAKRIKAK